MPQRLPFAIYVRITKNIRTLRKEGEGEETVHVMLNALEVAIENADEYEAGEYEEVLFGVQRKLDEEYDLGVE